MLECLLAGIGGFIGSVARYLVGLIPIKENISPQLILIADRPG